MTIDIQHKGLSIFTERPLECSNGISSPIHKHSLSEIHIVCEGESTYRCENTIYTLNAGDAIYFPPETYHSSNAEESARILAFQIKSQKPDTEVLSFPAALTHQLAHKNENAYNIIFFIVNSFSSDFFIKDLQHTDRAYDIDAFLSNNYNKKITLSDLAKELSVCSMQAQRIIKDMTGHTFGECLLLKRMTVAEHLMETTDLSLEEIAFSVGYDTYGGFRKAYKKYKEK